MTVSESTSHRRSLYWWIFATLWFAAWHLFVTSSAWVDPVARVPGPTGDNVMMLWNLGWVKFAFNHGSPGFWCPAAYYPDGYLFIYGSHTWLDGFLYWVTSWMLPSGWHGAILWANITMLLATVGTGLLIMSALRAWGVKMWPICILAATGAAFSWFRMFAAFGHYNFFGTQWMMLSVCLMSWAQSGSFKRNMLVICAGLAMGIAFLNDQTMAIFAGVLGGLVIFGMAANLSVRALRSIAADGLRFYGVALIPASIHLIPVLVTAIQGKLHYHVDKNLPRLVDASSLLLPSDYHFLGRYLKPLREHTGLGWSEGTYLGIIPLVLLILSTVASIRYIVRRSPELRVCFYATLAAWVFIVIALGDRLMIGRHLYFILPERLLKEIPLFNNMRVPQRWIWPAQLCIALSGASVLSCWLGRVRSARHRWLVWAPMALALLPPLEGRPWPMPAPVDFRNDPFIRPQGLIDAVQRNHTKGGVLAMPIRPACAQADILQFLWGYDIPMTAVYSARMPFDVNDVPWIGSDWTPETGHWLRGKQVHMVVFPFHGGPVDEYRNWIAEARKVIPDLQAFNKDGNPIGAVPPPQ